MSDKRGTDDGLAALRVLDALDPQGAVKEPIRAFVRSCPPYRAHSLALALAGVAQSKEKPHSWLSHALAHGYALEEAEKAQADRVLVEGVGLAGKKDLGGLLAALYSRRHGAPPPPKALTLEGGLSLGTLASLDPELYGWVKRETDRYAMRRVTRQERNGIWYEFAPEQTPELMAEAIRNGLGARGLSEEA